MTNETQQIEKYCFNIQNQFKLMLMDIVLPTRMKEDPAVYYSTGDGSKKKQNRIGIIRLCWKNIK